MTPAEAHAWCQQSAAASGSSFYHAFRFLEPARRRAITAFYAYCREVDDVVDECRDEGVARTKLAWWRSEVERLYEGAPQHPVTLALREAIEPYRLPREAFEEILDGMEMDRGVSPPPVRPSGSDIPPGGERPSWGGPAMASVRYDDYKHLHLYCHRVAGVVGEVSALIFGVSDRATLKYAHRLGLAFQLTNILRDVGEDARRGRLYLPLDELARFGVSEADILQARPSPAFAALMQFQYERAVSLYDEALALLPQTDRKAQRPGLIMAAIYRRLLEEVKDDGFRVLEHRIRLTPLTKLWLVWQTWWREA